MEPTGQEVEKRSGLEFNIMGSPDSGTPVIISGMESQFISAANFLLQDIGFDSTVFIHKGEDRVYEQIARVRDFFISETSQPGASVQTIEERFLMRIQTARALMDHAVALQRQVRGQQYELVMNLSSVLTELYATIKSTAQEKKGASPLFQVDDHTTLINRYLKTTGKKTFMLDDFYDWYKRDLVKAAGPKVESEENIPIKDYFDQLKRKVTGEWREVILKEMGDKQFACVANPLTVDVIKRISRETNDLPGQHERSGIIIGETVNLDGKEIFITYFALDVTLTPEQIRRIEGDIAGDMAEDGVYAGIHPDVYIPTLETFLKATDIPAEYNPFKDYKSIGDGVYQYEGDSDDTYDRGYSRFMLFHTHPNTFDPEIHGQPSVNDHSHAASYFRESNLYRYNWGISTLENDGELRVSMYATRKDPDGQLVRITPMEKFYIADDQNTRIVPSYDNVVLNEG